MYITVPLWSAILWLIMFLLLRDVLVALIWAVLTGVYRLIFVRTYTPYQVYEVLTMNEWKDYKKIVADLDVAYPVRWPKIHRSTRNVGLILQILVELRLAEVQIEVREYKTNPALAEMHHVFRKTRIGGGEQEKKKSRILNWLKTLPEVLNPSPANNFAGAVSFLLNFSNFARESFFMYYC